MVSMGDAPWSERRNVTLWTCPLSKGCYTFYSHARDIFGLTGASHCSEIAGSRVNQRASQKRFEGEKAALGRRGPPYLGL